MSSKIYGILAGISLAGLAFSLFGGASDLIGTIVIAAANGMAISITLKKHCSKPQGQDMGPAVAETVVENS
jgi:hypothetical protein